MPVRIQLALLFLIAAPLAMLGWIGAALIREQELQAKQQVAALANARLSEIARSIDDVMSTQHRRVTQTLASLESLPDRLTQLEWNDPHIRKTMWVSARGQMLYPTPPVTTANHEFLLFNEVTVMARQHPSVPRVPLQGQQMAILHNDVATFAQSIQGLENGQTMQLMPRNSTDQQIPTSESQWQEWYFDEGLQLVVWSLRPDGSAIGCWLERARWVADIISALPHAETGSGDGTTALVDANGSIIYRWGAIDIPLKNAVAELPLNEPLASWRLRYFLPPSEPQTATWLTYWPWALTISAIGLGLLLLGAYVSLATARQLRMANQRVSFAGQVSHELRTPLTNIRLYAEMAKRDLTQAHPEIDRISSRLDVIDSESRRLGRLISGVLEFIQGRNKGQSLMWRRAIPDDVIRNVLTQFALSLYRIGVSVDTDLRADTVVLIDSDILEQILVNLVSNVEKYASSGKRMRVRSRREGDRLMVEIEDSGPGIASRYAKRIFQPFFRLDDAITAPSGTGLGLTIARAAAKRHGGDLTLLPSKTGAHFHLVLTVRNDDEIDQTGSNEEENR